MIDLGERMHHQLSNGQLEGNDLNKVQRTRFLLLRYLLKDWCLQTRNITNILTEHAPQDDGPSPYLQFDHKQCAQVS